MQEVGRGGRDGNQCLATLFFHSSDIGANVKHIKDEVKQYCMLTTCRRNFLCKHFASQTSDLLSHNCCDICESSCECDNCIITTANKIEESAKKQTVSNQSSSNQAVKLAAEMLSSYFDAENSSLEISNPEIFTGLTDSLIQDITNSFEDILIEENFTLKFSHLQPHFLTNIYKIIMEIHSHN